MSGQSILFDIIARDKASSTFNKVGESASKSESHLKKFAETAKVVAGVAGAAVVGGGLAEFFNSSVDAAEQAQRATALTAAVIKSTGGAAHVTAAHIDELTRSIGEKVGQDHNVIQSGANMLLTFKDIRNEAGKGNKIFDQSTQVITDMAAAMAGSGSGHGGTDLKSTAILVGKALNDPIKGLTALRRVGVAFTEQQQKQIKTLVEHGHKMQAQKIILKELKSEFGGAAKSQATESDRARIAVKNLEEQVGKALLPTVDKLANFVTDKAVPAISGFVKGMQDGTGAGGEFAGHLHDLYEAGKHVADFIGGLPGPVKKYGAELVIATAVMSKFGGAFTLSAAQAEAGVTRTQLAMDRLRGGLRNLAGAGGVLMLANSTRQTNKSLGFLEAAAGGALTGFSVGGPWGLGIGAAAGALVGLASASKDTGNEIITAAKKTQHWTDALHGLTDASSTEARNEALKSLTSAFNDMPGTAKAVGDLGVRQRDLVNYITNEGGARKRVQAIIDRGMKAPFGSVQQRNAALTQLLVDKLKGEGSQLAGVIAANKKHNAEIATLNENIAKLPKKVQTEIHLLKGKATLSDAQALAKQYHLTPAKVQTLVEALNLNNTVSDVLGLTHRLTTLGKITATPKVTLHDLASPKLREIIKQLNDLTGGRHTPDSTPMPHGGMGSILNPSTRTQRTVKAGPAAPQFYIQNVYAQDVNHFLSQMQNRSRLAALDGIRR